MKKFLVASFLTCVGLQAFAASQASEEASAPLSRTASPQPEQSVNATVDPVVERAATPEWLRNMPEHSREVLRVFQIEREEDVPAFVQEILKAFTPDQASWACSLEPLFKAIPMEPEVRIGMVPGFEYYIHLVPPTAERIQADLLPAARIIFGEEEHPLNVVYGVLLLNRLTAIHLQEFMDSMSPIAIKIEEDVTVMTNKLYCLQQFISSEPAEWNRIAECAINLSCLCHRNMLIPLWGLPFSAVDHYSNILVGVITPLQMCEESRETLHRSLDALERLFHHFYSSYPPQEAKSLVNLALEMFIDDDIFPLSQGYSDSFLEQLQNSTHRREYVQCVSPLLKSQAVRTRTLASDTAAALSDVERLVALSPPS